jgi:uncharacterized membrane protein
MTTLTPLIAGLVIFLGGHIVTRLQGVRAGLVATFGEGVYRGLYSLVALMGLALIVHGFGAYRAAGAIPVWTPPKGMSHLSILLMWPAFILLAATYLPGEIRRRAKHPMLAAIKIWALAHLLANGDLGSILLFASFLVWAIWARIAAKRAGVAEAMPGATGLSPSRRNDVIAVLIGTGLALTFVSGLHKALIGVAILAL